MTKSEAEIVLELKGSYDSNILRKQYLEMAKRYHPDKISNLSNDEKTRRMQDINAAYDFLKAYLKKNKVASVKVSNSNSTNTNTNKYSYKTNTNTSNSNYYYKRSYEECFRNVEYLFDIKHIIQKIIDIEIQGIKELKESYKTKDNVFAIMLCDDYIEKIKELKDRYLNIYKSAEAKCFLDELFFLQQHTIHIWHKNHMKIVNNFYSERARKMYLHDIVVNRTKINEMKKIVPMIQAFLEIINKANDLEKKEKDLYLENIKNEIKDIINNYSYYAYYDQVKNKVLVIEKKTLNMILYIFNSQYKNIVEFESDIALTIKEMKESIDQVFSDYVNNFTSSYNQEQLKQKIDNNLTNNFSSKEQDTKKVDGWVKVRKNRIDFNL